MVHSVVKNVHATTATTTTTTTTLEQLAGQATEAEASSGCLVSRGSRERKREKRKGEKDRTIIPSERESEVIRVTNPIGVLLDGHFFILIISVNVIAA